MDLDCGDEGGVHLGSCIHSDGRNASIIKLGKPIFRCKEDETSMAQLRDTRRNESVGRDWPKHARGLRDREINRQMPSLA